MNSMLRQGSEEYHLECLILKNASVIEGLL